MAFSTEIDQLVNELERTRIEQEQTNSIVSGWTRSGDTNPNFQFMSADQGYFGILPHEVGRIMQSSVDQSLTTASTGYVDLAPAQDVEATSRSFSHGIPVDTTAATISLSPTGFGDAWYQVNAIVYLKNFGSTLDIIDVAVTDTSNALLLLPAFDVSPSTAGRYHTHASFLWRSRGSKSDTLKLRVKHNSATTATVDFWVLEAFRVR